MFKIDVNYWLKVYINYCFSIVFLFKMLPSSHKKLKINLPLKSFLSKEISLLECPDVLFFRRIWLLHGYFHTTFTYNEEGVTSGTLSDYIVSFRIEGLLQYV